MTQASNQVMRSSAHSGRNRRERLPLTGDLWGAGTQVSTELGLRMGLSQCKKGGSHSFQLDPEIPPLSLGRMELSCQATTSRSSWKARGRAGEGDCV